MSLRLINLALLVLFFTQIGKASLILSTSSESPLKILAKSDWSMNESVDEVLQQPACVAATQVSSSAEPVELAIHLPKSKDQLPFLSLKTKVKVGATVAVIVPGVKQSLAFVLLKEAAADTESNIYWYVPRSFAELVGYIRDYNQLQVILDPKASATKVQISLRGSANALNLAETCAASKISSVFSFFQKLNLAQAQLPNDAGAHDAISLMQLTQSAYQKSLEQLNVQTEIDKIRKPFSTLLASEKNAQDRLAVASKNKDKSKLIVDQQSALIDNYQKILAQGNADLEKLNSDKQQAENELASAKTSYQSLADQLKPTQSKVDAAQSQVNSLKNQINSNESAARNARSELSSAKDELDSMDSDISRLKSSISSKQFDLDRAERDLSGYDLRREEENYLDFHTSYRSYKSDLESAGRDKDRARSDLADAQRRTHDLEDQLNRCENRETRPEAPKPDCGSIRSQLNSSKDEEQSYDRKYDDLRDRELDLQNKMNSAQDEAHRYAQDQYDDLRRKRDGVSSEMQQLQSSLSNLERRSRDLNDEIPDLQQQIRNAESVLPGLRQSLTQKQQVLVAAQNELQQLKTAIGFQSAVDRLNKADAAVKNIKQAISDKINQMTEAQKKLPAAQKNLITYQKDLANAESIMQSREVDLKKVSDQLIPLREQEKPMTDKLQAIIAEFIDLQIRYQKLSEELMERN